MLKSIKKSIRKAIRLSGFDLTYLTPMSNPNLQLLRSLEKFKIDLVVDIGANTGQFASELRGVGYKGKILSFEPLSKAHSALLQASSGDAAWTVFDRCAIGDHDGDIEINISENSVSSSLLPATELNTGADAKTVYVGVEKVAIRKLDTVLPAFLDESKSTFLKIDTQGFEWQVLDGAENILSGITGVMCELSLEVLYKDQRLWKEVIQRLESKGFSLWSINPVFVDPRDGRTLQIDATFFRK